MQKIMFNEKYGLTEAVLQGRKTMTRRMISNDFPTEGIELIGITGIGAEFRIGENYEPVFVRLPYKVGEVVAIAQSYKDVLEEMIDAKGGYGEEENAFFERYEDTPGWNNKMFVRADLMPHRIRITDLWIERLQDISDEDCIKEGLWRLAGTSLYHYDESITRKGRNLYHTPREAFAALIDKVSGRGTWDRNPWVVAYSYKLVK